MIIENKYFTLTIKQNTTGFLYIGWGGGNEMVGCGIHFIITKPREWMWGYKKSWFDGPMYEIGFGPLFRCYWS